MDELLRDLGQYTVVEKLHMIRMIADSMDSDFRAVSELIYTSAAVRSPALSLPA